MEIIILGCGPSTGVPLITGEWGRCNPQNPRNIRRRSSVLVQKNGKNILIDAGPDVRAQLLEVGITHLDAVILTHIHADHTSGLDDLKSFSFKQKKAVPIYGDKYTLSNLEIGYPYALATENPFLELRLITEQIKEQILQIEGIEIILFPQIHGKIISWGIRIIDFAYSTDFSDIPEESLSLLKGIKCWVAECLSFEAHPNHSYLAKTTEMIEKIKPLETILTHMNQSLDYNELIKILPNGIRPAYDGMVIKFNNEEMVIDNEIIKYKIISKIPGW